MALRIRFQYPTGSQLGYSIERLADGKFYDFSNSSFVASPVTTLASLPEDTGSFAGRYKLTLSSTPIAQFANGDYVVTIHNQASSNVVIAELAATMYNGDDATVFPTVTGSSDPWATALPGTYAAGTAGAILGQNLDAKVSSRSTYSGGAVASVSAPVTVGTNSDKSGYSLLATQAFNNTGQTSKAPVTIASTDISGLVGADVQTIKTQAVTASSAVTFPASIGTSTYAGGAVASVSTPVTVGTNNDKSGYSLSSSGLDTIVIETGINARQALSPILAASAGVVSGAGTGVIVIKGGNSSITRITANTDNSGNRSSVTLTLPS